MIIPSRHPKTSDRTICLVTDEGGNTLQVTFQKNFQEMKELKLEIKELRYNGVSTGKIPKTVLQYEWSTDKAGNIKELEETVTNGSINIEGHYNAKKNVTEIKKYTKEKRDHEEDDDKKSAKEILPGLVIIKITTDKGKVIVDY